MSKSKVQDHLYVSQAPVLFFFDGVNEIESTASEASGVDCQGWSNLTFSGSSHASLFVRGGSLAAGIGPGMKSTCNSLLFINGSYSVSGETGIGSGPGCQCPTGYRYFQCDRNCCGDSVLNNLTIVNADIAAKGTDGAGIGYDWGKNGSSLVGSLIA
jgi:hypothetical protein